MSNLDWALAVSGGLIAPFLIVALIGCCLPRSHVFARSIVLKQNPRSIWESIAVFERLPGWWRPCVMVERLPDRDGHPVYRETFQHGRRKQAITIEVIEAIAPSRFATTIADDRGPFQGRWIYDLKDEIDGCRVTLTEHGELRNPFVRAMFRLMKNKSQFVESYLACLGRKFGEKVTVTK